MMFESIGKRLNEILGQDFYVMFNFNPQERRAKDIMAEYNPAILRPETGTIRPLKGLQGLQADCSLTLMVKIEGFDVDTATARISTGINNLLSATNGWLETEDNGVVTAFDYVINYGVQQFQDKVTIDGKDWAITSLPFNIVISSELAFGNSGTISVYDDDKEVYEELEGVVRWDFGQALQRENLGTMNSDKVESLSSFKIFNLTAICMCLKESIVQKKLLENLESIQSYKVKLSFNGIEIEKFFTVDINIGGANGQYAEMSIAFSEERQWQMIE